MGLPSRGRVIPVNSQIRPPITYFGGKQMLATRIAEMLPPHKHYVEPYCGSLAVLLAKRPSDHETVNDLDGDLVTYWRVVRDRLDELERVCALTPHSRAEHAASYDFASLDDDIERARRVWVQLTQGRGGVRSVTGWRSYEAPVGSTSMVDYLDGYLSRIPPASWRLRRASLECRPALDVITAYGEHPDVLLYVDPPYLGSTRQSGGYVHDMKDEAQHRELAEALHASKAAVVVSGYPSDLYDRDLYVGWDRHTMSTGTGQGDKQWGNRTEVLWSNRPIGQQPCLFNLAAS